MDRLQNRFLKDAGVDEDAALTHFNLAPLSSRRDMAMLGMIHRTMLGKGPAQFLQLFKKAADRKFEDPRSRLGGELVKRSAFGLVAIYNLLPHSCRQANTVKDFQQSIQQLIKERAEEGCQDWANTLSPRIPLDRHPLKK